MSALNQEMSRFTGGGKTFFFNRGEAKNGTDYIAVNALYGKGRQERMVLFPQHFLEFRNHLTRAITMLTGADFSSGEIPPQPQDPEGLIELPVECPKCNYGSGEWSISVYSPTRWKIRCQHCGHHIYQSYEEGEDD